MDDSCVRSFRSNFEQLVKYFSENISELLETAFKIEEVAKSNRALTLLTQPNETITQSLLENNLLFNMTDRVLKENDDASSSIKINRMASIVQNCCMNSPQLARTFNVISTVADFLNYAHYRTVFEMFISFLGKDEKLLEIQNVLKEDGLVLKFLDFITNAPEQCKDDPDDPTNQFLASLFKLIPFFKESSVFSEQICSVDAMKVISKRFINAPSSILNTQWAALSTIVNEENCQTLIQLLNDRFFDLLTQVNDNKFMLYQEYIIRFIQKAATFQDEFCAELIQKNLGNELATLLMKFPRHTLLHLAVKNLVEGVIEKDELVKNILQPIYDNCTQNFNQQPVEFKAFLWNLEKTVKDAKNDKYNNLESFEAETQKELDRVTEIVSNTYGGDVPSPQNDDMDDISNLSPDQLLALLRLITSGRR